MSHSMLEIKGDKAAVSKTTPHLLPCRIHHSGPVEPIQSFWGPGQIEDGKPIAYFRGRKLHGQKVKLPEGYRGAVVERQESSPEERHQPNETEVIDVDGDEQIDLGAVETKADFDEMVIWGHETTADAGTDLYVRAIEEWLALSEQIHSYPPESGS